MKAPSIPAFHSRAALAAGVILPCFLPSLAFGQFNKTAAGPWDYNDTNNWTGGVINGNFTVAPATALTTVTFGADTVLTTGLNFNYNAGGAGRGFALIGSGADRTITLGGNLTVTGSSGQRTVTIGSSTAGQNVNIDLGGVTRTFVGTSAGGLAFRTLNLVNVISNGGITTDDGQSGDSQLTLSGANTYAGGTTLFDGYFLNINNGGTSASNSAIGTGTLTLRNGSNIDNTSGSAVTLLTNNAQTWGTGTGGFTYRGSNALNLGTGAVTLGGTTTVTTTANTLTVGGAISGSGGLSKAGAGTLVLTNTASTYTGITQVSAGILEVSKLANAGLNSTLGAPVSTGGNTVLNGTGTLRYVGSGDSTNRELTLLSTPTLDASGSGALLLTSGSTAFGSSNVAVTFTLAGTSTANNTYSGNLGNNGSGVVALNKTGTGKWVLSGNTTYSGATNVSAGTLIVNGTHSGTGAVTVASGAKLGGGGVLAASTTISGILAPGNSIGTLTIANDVAWQGSATVGSATSWQYELGLSNTSDLLTITGASSEFIKDTSLGSFFNFDFLGSTTTGTFTLVDWASTANLAGGALGTNFLLTDFSYTNLGGGNSGSFSFSGSQLNFTVIPETNLAALLGGFGVIALLRRRRV